MKKCDFEKNSSTFCVGPVIMNNVHKYEGSSSNGKTFPETKRLDIVLHDLAVKPSTICVGPIVMNSIDKCEDSTIVSLPQRQKIFPETNQLDIVRHDCERKWEEKNSRDRGILSRGGSCKLLDYLITFWTWIKTFFNGKKKSNDEKYGFATPLPPSIVRPKIPILRGAEVPKTEDEVRCLQRYAINNKANGAQDLQDMIKNFEEATQVHKTELTFKNYPLRHLQKYTQMKNGARCVQKNLDEMIENCDALNSTMDKGTGTPMFRHLTMQKFEQTFRTIAKKRVQSSGNMIDIAGHKMWLSMAKIDCDSNGGVFKKYAGQKMLLNASEYKDVIEKISQLNKIDYWSMIEKMSSSKIR